MPKHLSQSPTAADLTVRERIFLFCVASGTDWQAVVPAEAVTRMIVRGVVVRDALGRLALTARGRAVLKAMLPELCQSDQ